MLTRVMAFRLLFAQTLDVVTFLVFYLFIGAGVYEERNPLILFLVALGGVHLVALVKIGVTLLVIRRAGHTPKPSRFGALRSFAVRHPRFFPRTLTIMVSAATASGIVGAGFNLGAIIHAML